MRQNIVEVFSNGKVARDGHGAQNYGTFQFFIVAQVGNFKETDEAEKITVGGRYCESGDILIDEIELPKLDEGDILCVYNTGAYNYSMASNYNRVQKPAMVLVNNSEADLIIKRETLADLVAQDVIPDRLK